MNNIMARVYSLRVWPNGEFGIGRVAKTRSPKLVKAGRPELPSSISWTRGEVHGYMAALIERGHSAEYALEAIPQQQRESIEADTPLDLAKPPNSHKRATRGEKGITGYGRKMLRNGCYVLEKAVGRRKTAMLTCTIPPLPDEIYKRVVAEWSEITRVFAQWLSRRLGGAHGYKWVVGCVEIQEERLEKYGGMPLHLHLAFQSRVKRGWTIDKSEVSRCWQRAICCVVPEAADVDYSSATRIEAVRKSLVQYMSKYISKGVNQNVLVSVEQGFKIPSSWWLAVGGIKNEIARQSTVTTGVLASYVWGITKTHPELFLWLHEITIPYGRIEYHVGVSGQLSSSLQSEIRRAAKAVRESGKEVFTEQYENRMGRVNRLCEGMSVLLTLPYLASCSLAVIFCVSMASYKVSTFL